MRVKISQFLMFKSMTVNQLQFYRRQIQLELSKRSNIGMLPMDIILIILKFLDSESTINFIYGVFPTNYKQLGLTQRLLREHIFIQLECRLHGLRYSIYNLAYYVYFPVFIFADWNPFGHKKIYPLATINNDSTYVNRRELSKISNNSSLRNCNEVLLTLFSGRYVFSTNYQKPSKKEVLINSNIIINTSTYSSHRFSLSFITVYPHLNVYYEIY